MAIKFKILGIPNSICEQEVLPEQKEKIAKRVANVDASLRKRMKKISRDEAEAWKKCIQKGRRK